MLSFSNEMLHQKNKKNIIKRGFTIIELVIVIAIIGIIVSISLPKFSTVQKDAKAKADIASAKVITDATYAQIAKGEILLVTTGTSAEIVKGGTGTSGKIIEYLQNVPIPKATPSSNYTVLISSDGDVTVKVGSNVLYPIAD
ncbi:MAG TPA: prepilin-type N-terminal cleavage/methylation domain-containing protein [Clostridium sp.]|uniref:prepilin-type N-terminal cleavage/methylation domain-containing protein n=1 Tax=Clostridium sp. TaxID=1506 RepID=UPI002F959584